MKEKGLYGSTLKWIAIVTMLCDHVSAMVLMPYFGVHYSMFDFQGILHAPEEIRQITIACVAMRYIGRLAFPIFAYMIVEGFIHTRNRWRYGCRLGLFAIISEIPFDLGLHGDMWNIEKQNVFFTLFLGYCLCATLAAIEQKALLKPRSLALLEVAAMVAFALGAIALRTDYDATGVLLIMVLYLTRDHRLKQCLFGSLVIGFEITSIFSFVLLYFYNGLRGKQPKWLFYWFYPVHLVVLWGIRYTLMSA